MNDAQYRELVAELVASYPPETAARLIEQKCRPPYKPALRIDVGQARAAARKETLTLTESAHGATGAQDGVA